MLPVAYSAAERTVSYAIESTAGTLASGTFYGAFLDSFEPKIAWRTYDPKGKIGGGLTKRGRAVRLGYGVTFQGGCPLTYGNILVLLALSGWGITHPTADVAPIFNYIARPLNSDLASPFASILITDPQGSTVLIGSRVVKVDTMIGADGVPMLTFSGEALKWADGPVSPTILMDADENVAVPALGGNPTIIGVVNGEINSLTLSWTRALRNNLTHVGGPTRFNLPAQSFQFGGQVTAPFDRTQLVKVQQGGTTTPDGLVTTTGALIIPLRSDLVIPTTTITRSMTFRSTDSTKVQWQDYPAPLRGDDTVMATIPFRVNDGAVEIDIVSDVLPAAIGATAV